MSDPALDIEASEQDLVTTELITISYGVTTHRITYADRDISYGGNLYVSTPGTRAEIGPSQVGKAGKELVLTMPVDHAFVRRYLLKATPPQRITVTLQRYYSDALVETRWIGDVDGISVDDRNVEASFRVPSRMAERLLRQVPALVVSKLCPFTVYDKRCKVDPTAAGPSGLTHKITTTVIAVSGREVRVDLLDTGRLGGWAQLGVLVHVTSGEQSSVSRQDDLNPPFSSVSKLTLADLIPDMKIGDSVEVYAGCDWMIATCRDKFDNKDNYGGYPQLPNKNPHLTEIVGWPD